MTYVATVVATACFVAGLRVMQVLPAASNVLATTRTAFRMLMDVRLSDAEKERHLQQASLALMRALASIVARAAVAAVAALLAVLVFQAAGLVRIGTVAGLLATWQGVALTTAASAATFRIRLR